MDELYTWRLAIYWFQHEPYGANGFNVVKNEWYNLFPE